MARVVLIEAQPRRLSDGAAVAVRLAGGGSRGYTHRGHADWQAGVVAMPRFSAEIGFDVAQGGFTGGAVPTTGAVGFAPADPALVAAIAGLHWADAPMQVRVGDDALADPAWTLAIDAVVAGIAIRGNAVSFTLSDLSRELAKPAAPDRFAGTGGIEGGADARDRVKRRSWGRCFNIEARLFDKAFNIYELGDPARRLQAISAVKDRGREGPLAVVGWAGTAAATLDALRAATVPAGGAAVAPSIALVKWWTQPAGPLTADLLGEVGAGYGEQLGDIAAALVTARSTLGIAGVAATNAARPGPCGLHIGTESETAAQALDRLLLGASTAWIVDPAGVVQLIPIALADPVETIIAIDVERTQSYRPVTERLLGYQKNERQHGAGEISALFAAADGSYADGTPIEDLKPAEPGADVTGSNVSAAVEGQGALATRSDVLYGSQINGLPAPIQPGNITGGGYLDARQVQYWGGPLIQTLQPAQAGADVTGSNVSAAVIGQGAFATKNSAAWSGDITGRPDPLVNGIIAGSYFDARYTQNPIDGFLLTQRWPSELGANVTESRTAAAVAGQGALATRNDVLYGSQISGLPAPIQPGNITGGGYLDARQVQYFGGPLIQTLQPAQAGADVTGSNVAAAVAGQGRGATANSLSDLDASAAAQLAAAAGGGVQVTTLYGRLTKLMAPGGTIAFDAAASIAAGGDSGTAKVVIEVSPAGAESWSVVAEGATGAVSASEPLFATASGGYTNSTGATRLFEFRARDEREPPSAGGLVSIPSSWLRG